jgi:hypothetical protein
MMSKRVINGYSHTRILTLTLLLCVIIVLPSVSTVLAAPPLQDPFPLGPIPYGDGRFFETGFLVWGRFYEFFDSRGGLPVFGYPRSRLYLDEDLGLWVQYFDNVRLEWHPELEEPYRVQLGLLGVQLGHTDPPVPDTVLPNSEAGRYFSETGHSVQYAFWRYYLAHGGLDILGYPITEAKAEGEYLVQYFERMRLEWHPERRVEDWIVPGHLGREYIYVRGIPAGMGQREDPGDYIMTHGDFGIGSALRITAGVREPVIGPNGRQTVSVRVDNRFSEPVEGASATVAVRFPSDMVLYTPQVTNREGVTQVEFPLLSTPPGVRISVEIKVQITVDGELLTGSTRTSFLSWW